MRVFAEKRKNIAGMAGDGRSMNITECDGQRSARFAAYMLERGVLGERMEAASKEERGTDDTEDAGLEDAARDEHEYLRRRLREELNREPTEEELDEWLRQHTEGY